MDNIKVILWGVGNMGSGMANMILGKKGIEIVGAINKINVGMDLGEHLGLSRKLGVTITDNAEEVLDNTEADIVFLAIDSFVKGVVNPIKMICRHHMNVITIAEEMSYPFLAEPELSKEIDECALANGVTVLGTGVNPGFVLDTLIITLSYACRSVKKVKARRVNDLSPFGKTVMVEQGVGLTVEAFNKGIADGSVYGHVGFEESIPMIADALGLEIDEVKQTKEPIISNVHRETKDVVVEPGMVCGCNHCGYGMKNGEVIITLEHPQQIHPELENIETGDYIWIEGDPDLNLCIKPETPGGIGTIAAAVNMIPQVLNAEPGLTTMTDLPVPHAFMKDVREYLKW
jgi:4-hydroxy-tetrahydrodipicolinate reductase